MSVSAVGGPVQSPYAMAPHSRSAAREAPAASGGAPREDRELTTVTTHCSERHWHTASCPHSVYTRPAPQEGEPGYYLDTRA